LKRAEKLAAWKAKQLAASQPTTEAIPPSAPAAVTANAAAETAAPAEPISVSAPARDASMVDAERAISDAAATKIEIEKALKMVADDNATVCSPHILFCFYSEHLILYVRRGKWALNWKRT